MRRVDGVALDPDARWRAGFKAYRRRGDLIVPFLMDTATSGVAPCLAADFHPRAEVSDNIPTPGAPPWSGVDDTGPWHARTASEHDEAEVSTDRRAPASAARATEGDSEDSARQAVAREIWHGSPPSTPGFPVSWRDVSTAAHRWRRASFRPGQSEDACEVGADEFDADSLRRSCLRFRMEREGMRRRHRREERELASAMATKGRDSGADASGVRQGEPQRSTAVLSSKQRLEAALELDGAHARERVELAAKQLLVHCEDAHDSTRDAGTVGTEYLVVSRATPEPPDTGDKIEASPDEDCCPPPSKQPPEGHAYQQGRAVGSIQRLWRRRHGNKAERLDPAGVARSRDAAARGPLDDEAATKLQSAFRGLHVRRALQVRPHKGAE